MEVSILILGNWSLERMIMSSKLLCVYKVSGIYLLLFVEI